MRQTPLSLSTISREPHYQDIWVRGKKVHQGYRNCSQRWSVIKRILSRYDSPMSVLDLGAQTGYFSYRIAEEFPAVVVAVEPAKQGLSIQIEEANRNPQVSWVREKLTVDGVSALGSFDVILALSFLHHQKDWREWLSTLTLMARSSLIVETPHPDEKLNQAVARKNLREIHETIAKVATQEGAGEGVWDKKLERGIFHISTNYPITGRVFTGNGVHGRHSTRLAEDWNKVLGYVPFPGSLNLRTKVSNLHSQLGPPVMEYVDAKRGKAGRKGGDYQIWPAKIIGSTVQCHLIVPGSRTHGPDTCEILAPVSLRETLGISDDSEVRLLVGPWVKQ
ncbi:MAG: DUF120 domain-containing protein [Bacilli bacterium]